MKNPFIVGEKIYLRELRQSDLDGDYISWLNDAEINFGNSHHVFPYSYNLAKEYIENANISNNKLILAIVLKENDIHIGNIALQNINFLHQNAEFAILLGEKKFWGKGYSKQASLLIIDHGFKSLNLNRIYCGTFINNIGMMNLANSLGMKKEGIRRKAIYKENKFIDIVEFGILKNEFYEKCDTNLTKKEI